MSKFDSNINIIHINDAVFDLKTAAEGRLSVNNIFI